MEQMVFVWFWQSWSMLLNAENILYIKLHQRTDAFKCGLYIALIK
jgi:hypothetical protein